MVGPTKTDITTPCPKCGGVMEIKVVGPSPENAGLMFHHFECATCQSTASFPFPKKVGA